MERKDFTPDEIGNGSKRGGRRKWGRAQWKFFCLILSVSVVCAVSLAISVYHFASGRGCIFLSLMGLPCPSCGLTRANLAFLRGDIAVAFGYHPVFFMPQLLGLLGLGYAALKKYRRWLLLAIVICITVFISVWIVRIAFFGWRG